MMNFLTEILMSFGIGTTPSGIIAYFISTSINIMILLLIGIFVFSFIRAKFLDDNLVRRLENKPKIVVYLGMAALGIISPFCSCSSIPAFVTFVTLGVPTGAVFVYLITSPLIQEASLILLLTQFGIPVTLLYIALGVTTGLIAGKLISKFKDKDIFTDSILAKKYGTTDVNAQTDEMITSGCGCGDTQPAPAESSSCCAKPAKVETSGCGCSDPQPAKAETSSCGDGCGCSSDKPAIDMKKHPVRFAVNEAISTLKSTYKFILVGIAFGAFIHGMVPTTVIEGLLGSSNTLAPIFATITGIPIYADDVALIPIAKSLIDKGAGLGTAISFVMSSAVVSIPSFILLAAVLKRKTIVKMVAFLIVAIILIGYLFNALQPFII